MGQHLPFLIVALLALWPLGASAQAPPPELEYEVGEPAPFRALCAPGGNGIVLQAFMEGGPTLAEVAFLEQAAAGECQTFPFVIWAELSAANYIGLFHLYHLWTLRFGDSGFSIIYLDEDDAGARGSDRQFDPALRET